MQQTWQWNQKKNKDLTQLQKFFEKQEKSISNKQQKKKRKRRTNDDSV